MWKHSVEIILDWLLDVVGEHSERSRVWWKMAYVIVILLLVVGMCVCVFPYANDATISLTKALTIQKIA